MRGNPQSSRSNAAYLGLAMRTGCVHRKLATERFREIIRSDIRIERAWSGRLSQP
jgi:hypothetical protein